jgi:hypothetical protein
MPDWKRIVGEKLGTLPLSNGRREEVIEELAEQLASAYEEALGEGMDEQEAMRSSVAQCKDWEKLRSQVFQSVEGTRLPVWVQNGVFAPRRRPVWIALGLSVLLFALPAFRQALQVVHRPTHSLGVHGFFRRAIFARSSSLGTKKNMPGRLPLWHCTALKRTFGPCARRKERLL